MDQLVKTRWIEKLRSGDYLQGVCTMNRHGKFCCLGVLMEVAVEDAVVISAKSLDTPGEIEYMDADDTERYWSSLSPKAKGWAGLSDEQCSDLIGLNDERRYSFDRIADYVEQEL